MNSDGLFIMVDGIDGAGKSTVIKTWSNYLQDQNKKVFNLKEYWNENEGFPSLDKLKTYDVIISAEPTALWVGKALREELVIEGSNYPPRTIAQAYALDRFILYKKIHLPLLKAGKTILQDRGVSTSLCYQSVQDTDLSIQDIANIEGNDFALNHNPNYLVIVDVELDSALKRLQGRLEKQDNSFFEKKEFLRQAKELFLSEDYQRQFVDKGTEIKILDSNVKLDIMKENSINLLKSLNKI